MSHAQNPVKGGVWLSVADAITIMLAFGSFVLLLVGTVVILVRAILDNQKDRHQISGRSLTVFPDCYSMPAVLNGSARGVSITCRRASSCVYFSTKNQHKTTKTKISGDPCSRNS